VWNTDTCFVKEQKGMARKVKLRLVTLEGGEKVGESSQRHFGRRSRTFQAGNMGRWKYTVWFDQKKKETQIKKKSATRRFGLDEGRNLLRGNWGSCQNGMAGQWYGLPLPGQIRKTWSLQGFGKELCRKW